MGIKINNLAFKPCISLLATSGQSLSYCIKYHEWISKCPKKCTFFNEGAVELLEEVEQRKYNIECLYFFRTNPNKSIFYCTLFNQDNPFCESCQYAKIQ